MTHDVIILGSGIVGAACAYELSRAGLSVNVIERDFAGCGTTAAGMGHVVVMDDSEEQFELTREGVRLWKEFASDNPSDIEFEDRGTLWVAQDEDEFELAKQKTRFYIDRDVDAELVSSKELRKLEPHLREGLAGGMLVPGDAVVYQLAATRKFLEDSSKITRTRGEVVSVDDKIVTLKDGNRFSADHIVNALGVSAPRFSPEIRLEPKKGHLLVSTRCPEFVTRQTLELGYLKSAHQSSSESVAFNIQPRATGQILIGSSRQPGTSEPGVEKRIVSKMLKRALKFMPGLKNTRTLRAWAGFRPSTPDNLPVIGKSTSNNSVIVAAGHEGLGITTSTITALLVKDLILGQMSTIDAKRFTPGRFQG